MRMCRPLGEACWTWKLGEKPSPELSAQLLDVYRFLKSHAPDGVLDVVPAYTELAVHFDPLRVGPEEVRTEVEKLMNSRSVESSSSPASSEVSIPVIYDGPDLERVATHTGLQTDEIIRLHSETVYIIAMIGFLPHFPYCLGLPSRLEAPRLPSPRAKVPAGSVALAGEQTGVYPQESPGGWNLIGRTDPALLLPLQPGDRLRFEAVEDLS